jgi:thiamine-phosphate pyrophosphorylase
MILSDDAGRLWDAARLMNALACAIRDVSARVLPPLLVFTDPARMPRPWEIAERLPAGAGLVYRHFGDPEAETVAQRLRDITRAHDVTLLIGLDADLADRVGADGVHLPERAVSAAYALSGRRPDWLLTGAVHDPARLEAGRDLHALVLSPIFTTSGPSSDRPALGVEALTAFVNAQSTPVYALGGIDEGNVDRLADSGACGIAGVGAFARAFGVRT